MTTTFAILFSLGLAAAAEPAQSPPAPGEDARPLDAVIRSFDPETRTVELITGVGHALRLVRLSMAPECRLTRGGAAAAEAEIEACARCRVQRRRTPAGDVALAIEIRPEGGQP